MRHNHHHGQQKRLSGLAIAMIVLGFAVVYGGVLFGTQKIGNYLEGRDAAESVGSLDGRFSASDVTMNYLGRTWTYRAKDITNILLIGVDWNEITQDDTSSRYGGQADFLRLISLDRANKAISSIQIDRDTMTDIRVYGPLGNFAGTNTLQISLAQAFGGSLEKNCENTAWAVSNLMGGIPINYYFTMDIDGIVALNDALGGITVKLEDDFTSLDPQMQNGATITLKGKQAEYYVRGRMSVGSGTNEARMRRQNVFMQAVNDKIKQGMNQDMNFVASLYDSIEEHSTTNMERGWLINKAYESQKYEASDVHAISGNHSVGSNGYVEFKPDEDSLKALLAEVFFE